MEFYSTVQQMRPPEKKINSLETVSVEAASDFQRNCKNTITMQFLDNPR